MRKQEFEQLLRDNWQLSMNFMRVLSNINSFLTKRMRVLSLYTVREKVAWLLLERAGEQGSNVIHLFRSRQEIADSFGIQKFSLLRVLSDFQKEGAIKINGREITILDRQKMK
jgi:CRP-like cAMP-binding protein